MALDQALLQSVQADNIPILRFYSWQQPTVSLGYFQSLNERLEHRSSLTAPLVRRSTGGGAIIHDRELTYSLCLPSNNRFGGAAIEVYQAVHAAILFAASQVGISLNRHADIPKAQRPSTEPFLCFQRRTEEDLVLSGYKIVGSAQRRSAGALLQHGSILVQASNSAPELPGIVELISKPFDPDSLRTLVIQHVAKALNIAWSNWVIPDSVVHSARSIEQRFGSNHWTTKRP